MAMPWRCRGMARSSWRDTAKETSNNFALVRCNADGSLDTTFDGDGKLTTDFAGGDDRAYDLAVQSDGKIIAAGYATGTSADFALARYNADGSLDTTFDGDGKLTTDFAGNGDTIYSVELQTGGKIVAAGYNNNPANDDFALARYNADGSLDTSFDGDGMVVTDLAGGDDAAYGLALLGDGRLVAAGYGYLNKSDFGAVRYNADGSLETSFRLGMVFCSPTCMAAVTRPQELCCREMARWWW